MQGIFAAFSPARIVTVEEPVTGLHGELLLARAHAQTAAAESDVAKAKVDLERREALAHFAIDEAESSLERLLAEPLRRSANEGRALDQVTYARRLVLAATTLNMLATRSSTPEVIDLSDARARLDRFSALLKHASGQGTLAAGARVAREGRGSRPRRC